MKITYFFGYDKWSYVSEKGIHDVYNPKPRPINWPLIALSGALRRVK